MRFVTKPISVALASLAVVSVLWNVYSRISFSGGGTCRSVLSGNHAHYVLLKEDSDRLDSEVTKLKKHKTLLDLEKKLAAKKSDAEGAGLPAKIAMLVKANEELRVYIDQLPLKIFRLKGSAEEHRKAVGELYDETGELKEKLNKLKSRLDGILKSIKSS